MVAVGLKGKTMQRTGELRFQMTAAIGPRFRLQEGWFCRETGESEWADVPLVDESGEPIDWQTAMGGSANSKRSN